MRKQRSRASGARPAAFFLACAVTFAATAAAATEPAAPEPVPIKAFAKKNTQDSVVVSPTGQYLAVTYPIEQLNQTALAIVDIKDMKTLGTTRFTSGEHIYQVWWANPERVVFTVAIKGGRLDQLRATGEMYSMDIHGKRQRTLFSNLIGGAAYMLDTLRDDPDHVLIMFVPWGRKEFKDPLIYKVNVNDGSQRKVAYVPGMAPGVATDDSGRIHFAHGMDLDSVVRLYRYTDDPKQPWSEVALPDGAPADVWLHGVTREGVVYLTTSDERGQECLREYRVARGFKDIECKQGRAGVPLFGYEDERIYALRRGDMPGDIEYLDPQHPEARLRQALQKAFAGQRVAIESSTADHRSLVVAVSSDRNPGDLYLVDRATRKAQYLMSARRWIDPAAMSPSDPIKYQTRDAYTIHGYLTARAGKATRNAPLVVMPHGGPHGIRDSWRWDSWGQLLASRGYAVLQVNYRGSGGYGELHERAGYRKWGTLMQDDLTDAVRWATSAGIADPARVCIFGASYGGYAALMSPLREPDLYRCAIGFAGVYDLVEHAATSDTRESRLGRNYLKEVLGDEQTMREHSPVTHIAKLRIPVLIAHGTNDRRVPFSQAKILRRALEANAKKYEWLEYMGEEHGLDKDENHEDFLTRVVEFLDRHIGPQSQAAKTGSGG
jgi:dipeptidyl aminopeptidase/acylaminoacyl peptidase